MVGENGQLVKDEPPSSRNSWSCPRISTNSAQQDYGRAAVNLPGECEPGNDWTCKHQGLNRLCPRFTPITDRGVLRPRGRKPSRRICTLTDWTCKLLDLNGFCLRMAQVTARGGLRPRGRKPSAFCGEKIGYMLHYLYLQGLGVHHSARLLRAQPTTALQKESLGGGGVSLSSGRFPWIRLPP